MTPTQRAAIDALKALADAADAVGVSYFDTDSQDDDVVAMQVATIRAREVLSAALAEPEQNEIERALMIATLLPCNQSKTTGEMRRAAEMLFGQEAFADAIDAAKEPR